MTWFTAEAGKIKTVAKGARQPKSRFAGTLDLFFDCEIQFVRSRKSELHMLRDATLVQPHSGIRLDFDRVGLAAYFTELLELTPEPDHPAPELYDLLQRGLTHLHEQPASRRALVHFETELARLLGIAQSGVPAAVALGRTYTRLPQDRAVLLKRLPSSTPKQEPRKGAAGA